MSEPHFRQRPWGYDRAQVDAFVERTASRFDAARSATTNEGAVKATIDQVTDETNRVLQQAYAVAGEVTTRAERDAQQLTTRSQQEAEQLTAQARAEAEALTARSQQEAAERRREAEAEAEGIVRDAEAQANALDEEIESLGRERQKLLADIERISQRLHALVDDADERPEPDETQVDGPVETARAVAARPARLAGPESQATMEMPGAVVAADSPGPDRR